MPLYGLWGCNLVPRDEVDEGVPTRVIFIEAYRSVHATQIVIQFFIVLMNNKQISRPV